VKSGQETWHCRALLPILAAKFTLNVPAFTSPRTPVCGLRCSITKSPNEPSRSTQSYFQVAMNDDPFYLSTWEDFRVGM
jgi:hypothetical protein